MDVGVGAMGVCRLIANIVKSFITYIGKMLMKEGEKDGKKEFKTVKLNTINKSDTL